ncbi:hydroxyacid dehydrogenase [Lacrimispora sp.]|uniref:hydroxyacid dehydrogenase n=1 Tax=Lacrimispora sp. TaxID=2719234 RepID=UPI0032E3AB56
MGIKVLIPQMIAQEGMEYLIDHGFEIKIGSGAEEEDLIRDIADCDAVLLRTAAMTEKVMKAGKKLKIVARHGAGYNNVDIKAASRLGIAVTNTPDATTTSVAEYTIGAMLAVTKRLFPCSEQMKNGNFLFKNSNKGMELKGKTLGIIGFGRIGRQTAQIAHDGLSMKIAAYLNQPSFDIPEYVKILSWEQLFRECDVISLHVPATAETIGFVGEKEFAWMKESAYFINCSRGEVVKEGELIHALEAGSIAGAFVDVFETEPPLSTNPLLHMPNTAVTPHMASNTEDCMAAIAVQAAEQIKHFFHGGGPLWRVND